MSKRNKKKRKNRNAHVKSCVNNKNLNKKYVRLEKKLQKKRNIIFGQSLNWSLGLLKPQLTLNAP